MVGMQRVAHALVEPRTPHLTKRCESRRSLLRQIRSAGGFLGKKTLSPGLRGRSEGAECTDCRAAGGRAERDSSTQLSNPRSPLCNLAAYCYCCAVVRVRSSLPSTTAATTPQRAALPKASCTCPCPMLLHRRQCEVRVCQARHLVPKGRRRNGDDNKPVLVADAVWALMSIDGEHNTTESCRNIEHPSWQRVAVFDLNLCRAAEGSAREAPAKPPRDSNLAAAASAASSSSRDSSATFERPSAAAAEAARKNKAAATPTAAAVKRPSSSSLNPFAVPETETQSLNPFASNFVPPATTPLPPPPPAAASPKSKRSTCPPAAVVAAPILRASLVLHLRVLHGRLRSKEVLGDVAVDLIPLLRSGGERLATDRLEWREEEGAPPPLLCGDGEDGAITTPLVAVDTWVSLRQGTAELRVQILIRPPREHPGSNAGSQRARGMSALLLRPSFWRRI